MEGDWIYIEDNEDDSCHSASDSDVIDSETEAELYSSIHYEENLNSDNTDGVSFLTSKMLDDTFPEISTPKENVFSAMKYQENVNIQLMGTSGFISNNLDSVDGDKKSPNKNSFLNYELKQGLNPAKKFKFEAIEGRESIDFASDNSEDRNLNVISILNNVQNEIGRHNSFEKQCSMENKYMVSVDSSDSDDNVIWASKNSPEKTNFKTNLLKNDGTMFITSSDSDDELPNSPSFRKRESVLKNLSMPNIKMGENYEGMWHINDEDLYRQRKYSHRYHENIEITCSNCNKRGHSFRACTLPKKIKCFVCGGAHLGSYCMNRMCRNCYEYGHDSRRCRMMPVTSYCSLCSLKGHFAEDCPDLWRRYHLTTQPVKIVKAKKIHQDSTDLYCWNCGDRGHFGALCHLRYSQSLPSWPCVVSYADPEKLLSKRLVSNRKDGMKWKERVKIKNFNNSRRIYAHLRRNELNAMDDARGKSPSRRERRKKRMDWQFKTVKKILEEQDFPRTPKNEVSNPNINSEVPETVELTIRQQLKNRKRNKRKLKRKHKKSGANAQNLKVVV